VSNITLFPSGSRGDKPSFIQEMFNVLEKISGKHFERKDLVFSYRILCYPHSVLSDGIYNLVVLEVEALR
jgi:hypothetical protein